MSATHREYYRFSFDFPPIGIVAVASLLTQIRGESITEIVATFKATGRYAYETKDKAEAKRVYDLTSHLGQWSGFTVEDLDEDGKPTDKCSWLNIYSALHSTTIKQSCPTGETLD